MRYWMQGWVFEDGVGEGWGDGTHDVRMIEVLHGRGRVLARIGKKRNGFTLCRWQREGYAPFGDRRGRE